MNIYAGVSDSRRGIYTRAVEDAIKNNACLIIPNDSKVMQDIKVFTEEFGLFDQCEIYRWKDIANGRVTIDGKIFAYLLPEMIIAEMLGFVSTNTYIAPYAIHTDMELRINQNVLDRFPSLRIV